MKKVLIITYYWPPAGGPGVQRVLKFIKYLRDHQWEPIILTVADGDFPAIDPTLLRQIPENIIVIKTNALEPHSLYRKLTGKKKDEKIPTFVLNPQKKDRPLEKLAKWIRAKIFIPDSRIGWIPFAVSAGRKAVKTHDVDLIFSTSPPPTVHLIARKLAAKTRLPWVADFRDPWTEAFWLAELQAQGMVQRLNYLMEKKVLMAADAVTSVSEGVIDLLRAKADNRYELIHNGFETVNDQARPADHFLILFFGHLNQYQHRETLFEAVKRQPEAIRKRIKISFIGKVFDGFMAVMDKYQELNIEIEAYKPYDELMDFAKSAAMLYRPLSRISYAMGGVGAKTYDYLALRKPMLAIGPRGSNIDAILQRTDSGRLFEEDEVDAMSDYIGEMFRRWEPAQSILLPDSDELNEFKTAENVARLAKLFGEL